MTIQTIEVTIPASPATVEIQTPGPQGPIGPTGPQGEGIGDHESTYNHGLIHTQNTDTSLAHGTADAVTAAQLAGIRDNLPAQLNRKASEQAVVTTYAASGSTGIQVANNANINFGTGDFTLVWRGSLPDWTSGDITLVHKRTGSGVNNGYAIQFRGSGAIRLWGTNSGAAANLQSTSNASIVDNSVSDICLSVQQSTSTETGLVDFYVNGVKLGNSVTIPTTFLAGGDNAADYYIHGDQFGLRTAAQTSFAATYNRALTAAEVWDLYVNGVSEADKYGSQVPVYESDFSAGVDDLIVSGDGGLDHNQTIGGSDGWVKITTNGTESVAIRREGIVLPPGKNIQTKLLIYVPSSNVTVRGVRLRNQNGVTVLGGTSFVKPTLDTVVQASFQNVLPSTSDRITIFPCDASDNTGNNTNGDVVYIKAVWVGQLGATLALEPEGITPVKWLDSSSNNLNATYPAAGWSLKRKVPVWVPPTSADGLPSGAVWNNEGTLTVVS